MIFLDTSAIYALADRDDDFHAAAVRHFQAVMDAGEAVVIHNYLLVESAALLQRRLGQQVARQFLRDAAHLTIVWVDEQLHDEARQRLEAPCSAQLSFVDAVSFEVMRQHRITRYLGFDQHFAQEGFIPVAD